MTNGTKGNRRSAPMKIDARRLLDTARKASQKAYAPYSNIRVGAAALSTSGKIFTGCNVENASLGLTCCAERVAVQNAVAAGERELVALAVYSPDIKRITPCGACRQVMAEFADPRGLLIIIDGEKGAEPVSLGSLLPAEFRGSRCQRH